MAVREVAAPRQRLDPCRQPPEELVPARTTGARSPTWLSAGPILPAPLASAGTGAHVRYLVSDASVDGKMVLSDTAALSLVRQLKVLVVDAKLAHGH